MTSYNVEWMTGAAFVRGDGSVVWRRGNIGAITRTGVGTYTLALNYPLNNYRWYAQIIGNTSGTIGEVRLLSQTDTLLTIETRNVTLSGVADRDFQIEIHRRL